MTNLKDVQMVSEETSHFLGRTQASHRRLILKSIKNLEKDMINSVKQLQAAPKGGKVEGLKVNLKQTQAVHKEVINIVDKQYNSAVKKIVGDFDEVSKHIQKSYKSLGESAKFTGIDRTMIDTLKNDTYEQFRGFGVDAQDRVSRAMYDTVIAKGNFSDLVDNIKGILAPSKDIRGRSMSAYADQYAFDSVMNFHNKVNVSKAEDLGMNDFLYVGDIIATTRSFCGGRAGGVYTKEQIESWTHNWTGKAGPAMTYRGGYRCRHHWRPVRKEWMGGKDRIDIADWNLEQIKKGVGGGSIKGVSGRVPQCKVGRARIIIKPKRSVKNAAGYIKPCQ